MIPLEETLYGIWKLFNDDTGLRTACGATNRIVKGLRRPDSLLNPSVTVDVPFSLYDDIAGNNAMRRTAKAPTMVNLYADLEENGAFDVPRLSTMAAACHSIVAVSKPTIAGASVHRMGTLEVAGPVFDRARPEEAYLALSVGWWITDDA